MADVTAARWISDHAEIMISTAVTSLPVASAVYRQLLQRKEVQEFWYYRFRGNEFGEKGQPLIGVSGGISKYDRSAAQRVVIPGWRGTLAAMWGRPPVARLVETLDTDRDANIILYGGCEPSELAREIQFDSDKPFGFGLEYNKYNKKMVNCNVGPGDISQVVRARAQQTRTTRVGLAAGSWAIVDRKRKRTLFSPTPNGDGTYQDDALLITFCPSYWAEGRHLLAFSGAREMGTYLSHVVLKKYAYMRKLEDNLRDAKVPRGGYFQAVVAFKLNPYEVGTLPNARVVRNVEVLATKCL